MDKQDYSDSTFPDLTERKQAENINSFLALSSSLVCIAGFDGYFKQLSPAWEMVLGFSSHELLSRPFLEFVHSDDIEGTIAEAKRLTVESNETISFVNRYRCKDRTYRWFQWNVTPEKKSKSMYCVAHDITALRNKQSELEESNYKLSMRISALDCLYKISERLSSKDPDFIIICQFILEQILLVYDDSEKVCGRINLYANNFQTDNFSETQWKLSANIFLDSRQIGAIEVYYLNSQPENYKKEFLAEEGRLINIIAEMTGEYCRRYDSDAALIQSEEKHRIFSEHSRDGFFVIQNGRLKYASNLFVKMVGMYELDILIGIEIASLLPADGRDSFLKMCSEIENGRKKRKSFRGQMVTKSGRPFWVDGHLSFVDWFGKGSIVGTLRDIDNDIQKEQFIKNEATILRRENLKLKSTFKDRFKFGTIIGKSQAMQEIYEQITEAGSTEASVVILGETGTGKEEVARNIHSNSMRVQNGFVPINCGAIPSSLFESELFGYKKGAFSGAFVDKHGFLDLAHQGTFFLDEVGEMDLNMQVKLLRVLETGEYIPVGSNTARHSDVRIISATNANLETLVGEKKMREDFYYRINVIPICLPPLRERKEDIPLLADFFLKKYGGKGCDLTFSGKELDLLCDHSWPGNIRELQNIVQRYMGAKNLYFFQTESQNKDPQQKITPIEHDFLDFRSSIRYYEKKIITEALEKNQWHKEKTAAMLGLPKRTFFRKLSSIGLKKA